MPLIYNSNADLGKTKGEGEGYGEILLWWSGGNGGCDDARAYIGCRSRLTTRQEYLSLRRGSQSTFLSESFFSLAIFTRYVAVVGDARTRYTFDDPFSKYSYRRIGPRNRR